MSPSDYEQFKSSPLNALTTDNYHPFFPWDAQKRPARGEKGLDASHGHQTFGPVSKMKGEMEFRRLITVYESIKAKGYIPRPINDGDIRGFLLRTEDDYRFVVRQGLHRTPALSVLGYSCLRAKFFKGLPRAIFLSDKLAASKQWVSVTQPCRVYFYAVFQRELSRATFFDHNACQELVSLKREPPYSRIVRSNVGFSSFSVTLSYAKGGVKVKKNRKLLTAMLVLMLVLFTACTPGTEGEEAEEDMASLSTTMLLLS